MNERGRDVFRAAALRGHPRVVGSAHGDGGECALGLLHLEAHTTRAEALRCASHSLSYQEFEDHNAHWWALLGAFGIDCATWRFSCALHNPMGLAEGVPLKLEEHAWMAHLNDHHGWGWLDFANKDLPTAIDADGAYHWADEASPASADSISQS